MASVYNTTIAQGETLDLNLTITNTNNTPKNLTGFTFNAAMEGIDEVVIPLTVNVTSPTTGVIDVIATSTVTSLWAPGQYKYDVYMTETATANRTRVIKGTLLVEQGVAK